MTTILEKALTEHTTDFSASDNVSLTKLEIEIDRLKEKHKSMYGFEKVAKDELEQIIRSKVTVHRAISRYKHVSRQLSTVPLTWRNEAGWPRLGLFPLNTNKIVFYQSIVVQYGLVSKSYVPAGGPIIPDYPYGIHHLYHDVIQKLHETAIEKKKSLKLSVAYSGVFPDSTREKIKESLLHFDAIFVLAEVDNWQLTESDPIPVELLDPAIIGYDHTTDSFWVIDHFDMTSLERFVISEF